MLLIWVHLLPDAKEHMDGGRKISWKSRIKFLSSVYVLTSLRNNIQMQPKGEADIHSPLLSPATGEEATDTKVWFSLALPFIWNYKGRGGKEEWSYCQSVGSWDFSWTEMVLLELITSVIITFFLLEDTKEAWESVWFYCFIYLFFILYKQVFSSVVS